MQNVGPITGASSTRVRSAGRVTPWIETTRSSIRRALADPIMGFAPWILFSVVVGPGRFDLAAGAALCAAVAILLVGVMVGVSARLLDLAAIAYFVAMFAIGMVAGHDVHTWLERWSGELSNVVIMLVALATVAVRRPFTIQYAREQTDAQHWDTPLFFHVNYVLTWVWIGAFFVTAAAGWYGDGPLHQPDNIWTNWIVSIAVLIFAIRFTEWYPERARSEAILNGEIDDETDGRTITIAALLVPLAAYLVPIGIVFLAFDAAPWWIGVALVVIGSSATRQLKRAEGDSGA